MNHQVTPELSGWVVYRRLLSHSLNYWPLLVLAVLAMLLVALTEVGFAALMRPLMDGSFVERDPDVIRWMPLAILGLFLVRGIAEFGSRYTLSWVGRKVISEMRGTMFRHLLQMPVSFHDRNSAGQLISRFTYNVEQVAGAATDSITILVRDTLTVIGLLAWMFYLNWKLTLTVFIVAPVIGFLVDRITRRFRKISRRLQGSMGDVTHVTGEVMDGHREVKIFGGEQRERERFEAINENNRRLHMKLIATQAINTPIIQFFVAIALAVIVWMASNPGVVEEISVGTFVSFFTAMLLLLTPVKRLVDVNATLQRGIAAGQNIFALLDEQPEMDTGQRHLDRAKGALRFVGIGFAYETSGKPVLSNIDLDIQPGESVALVGRSGSGKTTLASLLPRFYDPSHGEIFLDGENILDYRLADLRRQIAYVSQHVTLFNDTIYNNIAYGADSDVVQEQDVIAAAEAAYAMDFIRELPDGLQTEVGDNGVLLSGGQRQRLAIARALLKDAPILILDEATSALDTESERYIQKALNNLMRDRTTLVIAHRLSTVEGADRIVVMQNGVIAEAGRHQELLAHNGIYAHLHQLQFGESENA
ncbi:ATP-binding cassette, subfamily B, MsbA [Ectothiorhodosinus mongolicus]|uniref:ATP-binding cassette, subfamily B, MsbA n=1 Tax=Ectothiorhodosinus mongolicus TaxID=233100 RepID=A0A1R3VSH8_9GAMM|nr:lipid A export permease/ATP-binding protein MsbA [Ectothiorhodosinus mongolicus]ULX56493.1 lipid A export permease/ATP-binding protein MsbA [Ectothiorhodosinus mongolicus]SIT66111.1 ATP-binding cassette, subfamily B, MsbA [Ectothiorhodosinus mongolicus]